MNGFQSGKNSNLDKPFPGCLGRMVNLFDLNSGVAGNRLLSDTPHGCLSRSQSDVVRMYPSDDQIEEKVIVSDLKRNSSNRKSNGTPMKMLIAQEMSREVGLHQNPPSVVAKLMGLDTFPMRKSVSAARSHFGGHSRSHTDSSFSYCQRENGSLMEEMHHEFHQYPEQNEYKDVYEVRQQPTKINCVRSKSPEMARHDDTIIDKKVAFVRQKFIEAKCLSIDGKLRQSKEFQEALDVLSSNTDLFLKFLQEPNPIFLQHLHYLKSVPPPETERITVLRPSKMVDNSRFGESGNKNEKEMKRATQAGQGNRVDKSHCATSAPAAGWNIDKNPAQATRIVVLKPSPSKTRNDRAASSPPSASPRASEAERNFINLGDNEAQDSGEVAMGVTQQLQENLRGHRRDETLLSSVSSNGYIGDESSFYKSDTEYVAGNLSDSEVISPVSRHSWDYINRYGGPHFCSSLSRASYSSESSVSREAKKRLSERWEMVASNGSHQEQRHLRRSSSTLGEMLALSDTKKARGIERESSKEEPRTSSSNSMSNSNGDECIVESPRSLLRSKSVPVSSTAFGTQLNVNVQGPDTGNTNPPKETTKPRITKLSLKNLLFSRNKKASKDSWNHLQSNNEMQSGAKSSHYKDKILFPNDPGRESSLGDLHKSPSKLVSQNLFGQQGIISPEVGLFVSKSLPSGNQCESQDQPSPVSVLETTFEEDEHPARVSSGRTKPDCHGGELSVEPTRCNLIDKSPPIGSIARSLSWNDSCIASSVSLRPSPSIRQTEEEEKEWFSFVQTLLTVAGLNEVQSDASMLMWHSPESPLDPSLREKYVDLNEEKIHEARLRQRRSTRKLVFDCVNAGLMEIAGYGLDTCQRAIPYGFSNNLPQGARLLLADQVWARMKEWFSSEVKCVSSDCGDVNSPVVDGMVRKELVGKGWLHYLRLELDNIGMEIERKLLEELVHESIFELTGRV